VDDGLDNIHLDLNDLRQRFEHKQAFQQSVEGQSNGKSIERVNPLHKSDSILARLQKYESAALGMDSESKHLDRTDSDEPAERQSAVNGSESPDQPRSFADLNSLKSQWERSTPTEATAPENHETREELASLRQRIGVGRSASLRQMYEQGERPASSAESLPATSPAPSTQNGTATAATRDLADSMRRRFEQGEFESEHETQYREKLRRETQEELHLVQEADTAAKEAKQIFHRLDKMQSNGVARTTIANGQSNGQSNGSNKDLSKETSADPSDLVDSSAVRPHCSRRILSVPSEQPTDVIKSSEPGVKDVPTIDTAQLQERYRFFERQASGAEPVEVNKTSGPPPKPIALPRDLGNLHVVETPAEHIQRDPNVIRSSDVVDDRPKGETTKRMLDVFKRMEQLRDSVDEPSAERSKPPPLRCITPPAEYTVEEDESVPVESSPSIESLESAEQRGQSLLIWSLCIIYLNFVCSRFCVAISLANHIERVSKLAPPFFNSERQLSIGRIGASRTGKDSYVEGQVRELGRTRKQRESSQLEHERDRRRSASARHHEKLAAEV
jgi:hypothetical protein